MPGPRYQPVYVTARPVHVTARAPGSIDGLPGADRCARRRRFSLPGGDTIDWQDPVTITALTGKPAAIAGIGNRASM
jgi:hypothetical protein